MFIVTKLENYANLSVSPTTIRKFLTLVNRTRKNGTISSSLFLVSGLSKSEPFSSIFHDGEFKRGPELAELIAESYCAVSNELAPLCFNKLHITSVPDEYIISTQQVEIELEKISLQKAIGPDDIPNWVLKSAAPLLAGPISLSHAMRPGLKIRHFWVAKLLFLTIIFL